MCNPLHSNPTNSSSDATTNGAAAEVFSVRRTMGFESSSVDTEPSGVVVCKQLDKADTDTATEATMNGNDYLIGVFSVPTKGSKEAEESSEQKKVIVDTRYLSAQDLKTLKKQDPFLYYSLPSSVRRNAGRNSDMDYMSSPLIGKSSTSTPTTTVERRSCISFECHTDLLLEDEWLNDADAAVNEAFEVDVDFDSIYYELLCRPKQ